MRKIDPVNVGIYILSLAFLFVLGIGVYNVFERDHRITARLEAVETLENEEVYEFQKLEKIEEAFFEIEDSMVYYSAPEEIKYFDVPLSESLQDYIFEVCENYGVDPDIIVAMIYKESTYRANCMGDNGRAYGLMQVQPRWHQARMDKLGVTDLLDPYQNVLVGIDYFAELMGYDQGLHWSLMAYNGGITYANKKTAAGEVSGYVKTVINKAAELRANMEGE